VVEGPGIWEPLVIETALELGAGFKLRMWAASEAQEKDTLGFWNDFHTGSVYEELIGLSVSCRNGPNRWLVGSLGAPRVVDRTLDQSLLEPAMVFATVGIRWSF
jgi:hypothetical protein